MRVLDKEAALALLETEVAALPRDARCPACAVLRAGREAIGLVAESEHGVVVLNRYGSRAGHLLVLARRHVEHVHELPWATYADLQRLAYQAGSALHARYAPARIYTAVLGSPMPILMSYPHLHVHVVPVMETDEAARPARVFSWSEGVVMYDDVEAATRVAELRAAWPSRDA